MITCNSQSWRRLCAGLAIAVLIGTQPQQSNAVDVINDADLLDAAKQAFGVANCTIQPLALEPDGSAGVSTALMLGGIHAIIDLAPHAVRSGAFELRVQDPRGAINAIAPSPPRTVRGTLRGRPGTRVAGSVLDDGLYAMVMLETGERYWIEPLARHVAGEAPELHVVYRGDDAMPSGGTCGGPDGPGPVPPGAAKENLLQPDDQSGIAGSGGGSGGPEGTFPCVTQLACDADVEYFQDYGASVAAVLDRIELVVNTMNPQYETQTAITHLLTGLVVRTAEPDPYAATGSDALLCELITHWTNSIPTIPRDATMLFTGREVDGTTIGQAANFGEICDTAGFCQAEPDLDDGHYCYVQSDCCGGLACSTDLSAHELGHLWSATHCSCPGSTMHPFIQCANTFNAGSISQITSYRDSVASVCLNCNGGTPPSDSCADAPFIGLGSFYFNTIGATTDGPDEPDACDFFGYTQVGSDIWFRHTGQCTGVLTLDLCDASYDTKVAIYDAACPSAAGSAIACNDDACGTFATRSHVTAPVIFGHQYRIRIGGYSGLTGTGVMTLSCHIPDDCADAVPVGEGSVFMNSIGATTDGPNEPGACNFFGYTQVGSDIWFRYTPSCTGTATVDLCSATYDSKVAIYGGTCPSSPGTAIACNDDACGTAGVRSQVSFPVLGGASYLIRVGGYQGATGTATMNISCAPPDDCADAVNIAEGSYNFSTIGATTDGPNESESCNFFGYTQVGSDIWFRYTASCAGLATADLCNSNYDTKVAIYSISPNCPIVPNLASACNDDACGESGLRSRVVFPTTAGGVHLIRVGGFLGATGAGVLALSCDSCPADINNDGLTNVNDLLAVINAWGACAGCPADVTLDNQINVNDLLYVLNFWGPCP